MNNGQVTSEMETSCKQNIPNAQQIGFEILEKGGPAVGAPFNTNGMYRDIRPMIVMIYKD